jgi:hypothetical protein
MDEYGVTRKYFIKGNLGDTPPPWIFYDSTTFTGQDMAKKFI